jgi:hypothetical protein
MSLYCLLTAINPVCTIDIDFPIICNYPIHYAFASWNFTVIIPQPNFNKMFSFTIKLVLFEHEMPHIVTKCSYAFVASSVRKCRGLAIRLS